MMISAATPTPSARRGTLFDKLRSKDGVTVTRHRNLREFVLIFTFFHHGDCHSCVHYQKTDAISPSRVAFKILPNNGAKAPR